MQNANPDQLAARRAIESLRSGVPNPDVVRALDNQQPEITAAFGDLLKTTRELDSSSPNGLILTGGFGTGKSHILEQLRQTAFREGFAVSTIAISKETPLGNPARVTTSAIEHLATAQFSEDLLKEIVARIRTDTEAFATLVSWTRHTEPELSPLFETSLILRHNARRDDLELLETVLRAWTNDKVTVGELKSMARKVDKMIPHQTMPRQTDRAWQTVRFLPHLLQAAGLRGWIVLLDEVELVGRYGPVSRAIAYDQLAKWLGLLDTFRIGGLGVVAALTDDFADAVLVDKGDWHEVPRQLSTSANEERQAMVPFARAAMSAIRDDGLEIRPADEKQLRETAALLRDIYALAYLIPAGLPEWRYVSGRPMRSYIRRWINQWDLERMYPSSAVDLEEDHLDFSYDEQPD